MTDHSSTAPAVKTGYFLIYGILVGLVFLAIGVSFMDLGPNVVYLNFLIAGSQAALLVYFFMHLKGSDRLIWLIVGASLFWMIILFLFVLTDYVTRHIAAY